MKFNIELPAAGQAIRAWLTVTTVTRIIEGMNWILSGNFVGGGPGIVVSRWNGKSLVSLNSTVLAKGSINHAFKVRDGDEGTVTVNGGQVLSPFGGAFWIPDTILPAGTTTVGLAFTFSGQELTGATLVSGAGNRQVATKHPTTKIWAQSVFGGVGVQKTWAGTILPWTL